MIRFEKREEEVLESKTVEYPREKPKPQLTQQRQGRDRELLESSIDLEGFRSNRPSRSKNDLEYPKA